MRILIVDDDASRAESLGDLLESRGHEAMHARTADDAGWLAGFLRFEAAFIDDDLAGSAGLEAAARVAEASPQVRCVLVTSRPASELRPGAYPYLQKPLALEPIASLLREIELERAGSRVILRTGFPLIRTGRRAPGAG